MSNSKPHCSVDYHNFNGDKMDTKAHLVAEGIYGNDPPFTAPPFTELAFTALIADHHTKWEAYKNGGQAQKGPYLTSRTALVNAMDKTGDFVDERPGVDDDMILLAGFTPTKTGGTKTLPPNPPTGIQLSLGISGEMFSDCDTVTGDAFYGSVLVAGKPLPDGFTINNAGQVIVLHTPEPNPNPNPNPTPETGVALIADLNKQRKKHYTGLTKGVEYYCYYYAINSGGVSQLSGPVILMCG